MTFECRCALLASQQIVRRIQHTDALLPVCHLRQIATVSRNVCYERGGMTFEEGGLYRSMQQRHLTSRRALLS